MATEIEIRLTCRKLCPNFFQMDSKEECIYYHYGTGHLCSLKDTDHICHIENAIDELTKLPKPEKFGKGGHSDSDSPPPMSRG